MEINAVFIQMFFVEKFPLRLFLVHFHSVYFDFQFLSERYFVVDAPFRERRVHYQRPVKYIIVTIVFQSNFMYLYFWDARLQKISIF